jgi:hypothetical protein
MKTMQRFLAAGLAVAVSGAVSSGLPSRTMNGDDSSSSKGRPPSSDGGGWDNPWVSEETVELNRLLYQTRDQIAMMAQWDGPGPLDIHTLRTRDDFSSRRAESASRARGPVRVVVPGRSARVSAGTAGVDPTDPGAGADNRSLARFNLWPNGEIPYTFSDAMIEAFFFVGDRDPEQVNAAAGVASALAVMITMEQETPLRFVGYDPAQHQVGAILIWDNIGDGENPPPIEDADDADTDNSVTRIGRSLQISNPDVVPTTIAHGYWQNFPSIVRSIGFAIGLDWEQRHPDRDTFIEVHVNNIPPAFAPDGTGWPRFTTGDGNLSPGFPALIEDNSAGQQLFAIAFNDPTVFPAGDFDLDSMMLIDEFSYNNALPMYTIRDAYRYRDLDGDDVVDTTPFGPDDLMVRREPIFFSAGDIAAIEDLYTPVSANPCPADVNEDGVVSDFDIQLYLGWYAVRDLRAELTGDTCTDANNDGIADGDCIDVEDLVRFFVLLQQSTECGTTANIGGSNTLQPIDFNR